MKKRKAGPRIIIWDIETPYLEAAIWRPGMQYVAQDQLREGKDEFSVLSFAAKELGSKDIIFESVAGQRDPRDDRKVIKALWKVLDSADIYITQNGKQFDFPLVTGRFAKHKLGAPAPAKHIDTYQMGRKMGLPSTKLAYMTEYFCPELAKSKHEKFPGRKLWDECLAGNAAAWREMAKYNKQDVIGTEGVYNAMAPYVDTKINFSAYTKELVNVCPACGGTEWINNGFNYESTGVFRRYKCKTCGKHRKESGKANNQLSDEKLASMKGKA